MVVKKGEMVLKWLGSKWTLLVCLVVIAVLLGINGISVSNNKGNKVVITIGNTAYAAGTVDYQIDGVADDVQFQAALNALPVTGGRIVCVSATTIAFTNTVSRAIDNVVIEGSGAGTYFANDGGTAIFDAGVQDGWVFRDFSTDAGGIDVATATTYRLENVTLGATYYPITYTDGSGVSYLSMDTTTGSLQVSGANVTRGVTVFVASCNATAAEKAQADYLCDGADDDMEWEAADAALAAVGGGTLKLSTGGFSLGKTFLQSSNVTLQGQGSSTVVSSSFGSLNAGTIISNEGFNTATGYTAGFNYEAKDFAIDAPYNSGITYCHAQGVTIERIYGIDIFYHYIEINSTQDAIVRDCILDSPSSNDSPLQIDNAHSVATYGWDGVSQININADNTGCSGVSIIGCHFNSLFSDSVEKGIELNGGTTATNHVTITGCVFRGHNYSIYVNPDAAYTNLVISNCTFFSCLRPIQLRGIIGSCKTASISNIVAKDVRYQGITLDSWSDVTLNNIVIDGIFNYGTASQRSGILIYLSTDVVGSNIIVRPTTSGLSTGSGIDINHYGESTTDKILFNNVQVYDAAYGVYHNVGSADVTNLVTSNVTTDYYLAAPATKLIYNSGSSNITSGSNVRAIAHGMAYVPDISKINLTPTNDLWYNGAQNIWISDNATSTYFWVQAASTANGTNSFEWSYRHN